MRRPALDDQQVYDIRLLHYQHNKSYGEIRHLTGYSLSTISKYCWRDRDGAKAPQAAAATQAKA